MTERRRGLGRGLGALIPEGPPNGGNRPVDVFFPHNGGAGAATAVLDPPATGLTQDGGDGAGVVERAADVARADDVDRAADAAERADDATTADGAEPPDDADDAGVAEDAGVAKDADATVGLLPVPGARFAEVEVGAITPNPRQPRQTFDDGELDELARSVREVGILQPVVVRPDPALPGRYELIMGERRWRAAQAAGLLTVPAIVRLTPDSHLLRDALLENLHRAELNPLEEAAAYQQLLEDFGCTHDELASRVARSRPQISNTIRLLRLPASVQRLLATGALSAGHARAVLGAGDPRLMESIAERVVAEGLSVRATEALAARGADPARPRTESRPPVDGRLDEIAARLSDALAVRVRISQGRRAGRIAIEFTSPDDLDRILAALTPAT